MKLLHSLRATHPLHLVLQGLLVVIVSNPLAVQATTEPAGTVWMLKGQVKAERPASPPRVLRLGDSVSNGETLTSLDESESVLKMADGAMLALRPNSTFRIENVKRPDESGAAFILELVRGGLRVLTGLTGRRAPDAYKVRTPTATIGIRGTDHEPYVLPSGTQIGRNPAGTYDKVNSGATFIATDRASTNLQPGQVGFARDTSGNSDEQRSRAMATLLRPVILRYVPEFFQQGVFDQELAATEPSALDNDPKRCDAGLLARQWLGSLDGAVANRESNAVLELFASDVEILIKLPPSKPGEPKKQYAVGRDEFSASVIQSVRELEQFAQLRRTIRVEQPLGQVDCSRLKVSSEVQESGRAMGQFYQSNSVETFDLRKVGTVYKAVAAEVESIPSR